MTTSIISLLFGLTTIFTNTKSEFKLLEIDRVINYSVQSGVVKTERIEKKRKFLFWKLPHKKVVIIDKFLDSNNNVIFKKKSISICSNDACSDIKFRRIKIVENEIWIFKYNKNPENAVIKRYDFEGKYLGKQNWTEKSFDDY